MQILRDAEMGEKGRHHLLSWGDQAGGFLERGTSRTGAGKASEPETALGSQGLPGVHEQAAGRPGVGWPAPHRGSGPPGR